MQKDFKCMRVRESLVGVCPFQSVREINFF